MLGARGFRATGIRPGLERGCRLTLTRGLEIGGLRSDSRAEPVAVGGPTAKRLDSSLSKAFRLGWALTHS